MISSRRPPLAVSNLVQRAPQTDYQHFIKHDTQRSLTTTPSPPFSTSTYMQQSSTPFFFVPALTDPRALSTSEGTTSVLVLSSAHPRNFQTHLELLSPLYCAIAKTASIPFSCATAFASRLHFFLNPSASHSRLTEATHSNAPSETNGRKNGSVSEAVFADFAMTSL